MSLLLSTDLRVWFEGGVPYGLVRDGRHYRVTDTPTRLAEDAMASGGEGWRFQATDDDEVSRMFEIRQFEQGWGVARVYD